MRGVLFGLFLFLSGTAIGAVGFWQYQRGPLYSAGTATTIDGDNIEIAGTNWRLAGIDAPELPTINGKECRKLSAGRPECTNEAAAALQKLVEGKLVNCWRVSFDWHNQRPVGRCYLGEIDLAEWILINCYAGSPKNKAHRIEPYEVIIAARDCPS